eukprot:365854-Chlamydomonas_euryale.AAC.2
MGRSQCHRLYTRSSTDEDQGGHPLDGRGAVAGPSQSAKATLAKATLAKATLAKLNAHGHKPTMVHASTHTHARTRACRHQRTDSTTDARIHACMHTSAGASSTNKVNKLPHLQEPQIPSPVPQCVPRRRDHDARVLPRRQRDGGREVRPEQRPSGRAVPGGPAVWRREQISAGLPDQAECGMGEDWGGGGGASARWVVAVTHREVWRNLRMA